jgi:hypothetical protein
VRRVIFVPEEKLLETNSDSESGSSVSDASDEASVSESLKLSDIRESEEGEVHATPHAPEEAIGDEWVRGGGKAAAEEEVDLS